jgi:hypothetical protein
MKNTKAPRVKPLQERVPETGLMGSPKAISGIGQEISILSLMLSLSGNVQRTETQQILRRSTERAHRKPRTRGRRAR